LLLAFWSSSTVALRTYLYRTIKVYQVKPLEPGEEGSLDIAFWSSAAVFAGVVTVFLLIEPGALARLRPVGIVLLTVIGAALVARRLAVGASSAVHGPSIVRRAITRKQCAKRYPGGRQCSNWAFRWGEVCRWHINAIETTQRYGTKMRTRQGMGVWWLCVGLFAVTKCVGEIEVLWAMLAVVAVGAGLRFVAEGINAPYYALSQLAIWPKAQALGLAVQSIGATAMLIVLSFRPETARPLVALLGDNEVWLAFGPAAVYVAFAAVATVGLDVLTARVLHYLSPSAVAIIAIGSVQPMQKLLEGPLLRYSWLGRWTSQDFWAPVLPHDQARVLPFTYLGAYVAAQLVASLITARPERGVARVAVCSLAALSAMLITRYMLQGVGVSGTNCFAVLTVALSAGTCLVVRSVSPRRLAAAADRS
jgi:hypothetical protein